MQYRYHAKSLEGNHFDAIKAELSRSRARDYHRAQHPADTGESTISGNQTTREGNNFYNDIQEESGLRPDREHFSATVLGGILSVAAAIAGGLIIASTPAFRLAIAPDMQASADVIADMPVSTASPDVAAAKPVRPIPAPPAPSLSIPKHENPRAQSARPSTKTTALRKPSSSKKALKTRLAGKAEKQKIARATRRTSLPPMADSTVQKRAGSVLQAASKSDLQNRGTLPTLASQYARCTQQAGFLRRERCKWEVCGGKWGKQGCPSYKYKVAPEMGLGQFHPAEGFSQQDDS